MRRMYIHVGRRLVHSASRGVLDGPKSNWLASTFRRLGLVSAVNPCSNCTTGTVSSCRNGWGQHKCTYETGIRQWALSPW